MITNCWYLNGECVYNAPEGYYGYIYLIQILPKTPDEQYRYYIGKKAFSHSLKKTISKKRRKEEGTRKRVERVQKDSGWLDYYGSSKELNEYIEKNGTDNIKRNILKFCKSKIDLTYWEIFYLIQYEVLFDDMSLNGNIAGKFYKGRISK